MNGHLIQIIALCSAANGVINQTYDPDALYPFNGAFQYNNLVNFTHTERSHFGDARAEERFKDPTTWLHSLNQNDASRAWLIFTRNIDQSELRKFTGGTGLWQLAVAFPGHVEIWTPTIKLTRPDAADRLIWSVTYNSELVGLNEKPTPSPNLNAAKERLFAALQKILEFAGTLDNPMWQEWFQRGADCLDSRLSPSFPDYVKFVCLDLYPDTAQRLFAAACSAWVFSGMGSWNDAQAVNTDDLDEYNKVSAELYAAICFAIETASRSALLSNRS